MNQVIRTIFFHKLKCLAMIIFWGFIFLNPGQIRADEKQHLFSEGNTLYQNGQFHAALESYQKIISMGYENGSLYYNIGNCYYKLQDIGRAILFYEKALKFIPGDEDLKANLALANLAVVDKVEPQPQFILFRLADSFIHIFDQSILVLMVMGSYICLIGSSIIWIITRRKGLRLISSRLGFVFGIFIFIFGLSLAGQLSESHNKIEGIILVDKIDVMSAPAEGMEIFSLHMGTKVRIDQRSGDWVEIILADGKVGWIKHETIEII